jgi:penicillin-binding protein 1B
MSKNQSVKSRPKGSWAKIIKIAICLFLLLAIPVLIFLIRYYYIFDGIIEQKLGKGEVLAETVIYSAPIELYAGKRISDSALLAKVRRLGYEENNNSSSSSYYYKLDQPSRILIHNGSAAPVDANGSVEITFSGNAIRSMKDVSSQTAIERFSLIPEMLSNAIGKNREKRRFVKYEELPQSMKNAVLAAEDRRFFSHKGIDPIRIIQALIIDIRKGDTVQGASTLTQQFVKNYFLTQERTWRRKLSDAYMSILLENRFSKEQIFELYCNEVYLGQVGSFSIVGLGEGANAFFNKNVRELTLDESATLAGLITAPNRQNPLRHKERATARRNLILDLMANYEMIASSERDAAKSRPLQIKLSSALNYSDAPYFVDFVQDQLVEKYGDAAWTRSRFNVYTSLDKDLQQAAFEAIQTGVTDLDALLAKRKPPIQPGVVQASLIAVDPKNGHILTMVGGRNYGTGQFNRITQSKRQPGSIFKPFVYAAALESAYDGGSSPLTTVSTVLDQPTAFTFDNLEYEPRNFKEEYMGQVTMRQAITKSLNVATIKFAEKTGYEKIVALAKRLGLNEQIKPYPAMAIGSFEITPLEIVRAYTAFAHEGLLADLTAVLQIQDSNASPIFVAKSKPKEALKPPISFLVTSLLQSVIDHGTGQGARARGFALPAAGKTGTSHDGWFAGYTPDLLCIVWVGFDDNRELGLSGSQSALPIWTDFMKRAAALLPLKGEAFTIPDDIVEVEIDPTTGLLATERCLQKEMDYFIKGTEPTIQCYGNNYEQSVGFGTPTSIYSTHPKEAAKDADNKKGPRN